MISKSIFSGLLDERDYEDDELELGGEAVPGPGSSFNYAPDRLATHQTGQLPARQVSYPPDRSAIRHIGQLPNRQVSNAPDRSAIQGGIFKKGEQ